MSDQYESLCGGCPLYNTDECVDAETLVEWCECGPRKYWRECAAACEDEALDAARWRHAWLVLRDEVRRLRIQAGIMQTSIAALEQHRDLLRGELDTASKMADLAIDNPSPLEVLLRISAPKGVVVTTEQEHGGKT